jgi:hypothetical protein
MQTEFGSENVKVKDHLEDFRISRRITLKLTFGKLSVKL